MGRDSHRNKEVRCFRTLLCIKEKGAGREGLRVLAEAGGNFNQVEKTAFRQ